MMIGPDPMMRMLLMSVRLGIVGTWEGPEPRGGKNSRKGRCNPLYARAQAPTRMGALTAIEVGVLGGPPGMWVSRCADVPWADDARGQPGGQAGGQRLASDPAVGTLSLGAIILNATTHTA